MTMIRMLARLTLTLFACAAAAETPQLSVTPASGPVDAPLQGWGGCRAARAADH